MTADKMRELAEQLVLKTYDRIIESIGDGGQNFITREDLIKMKLDFQGKMNLV